jgi:PAS domain S-box-containing protein
MNELSSSDRWLVEAYDRLNQSYSIINHDFYILSAINKVLKISLEPIPFQAKLERMLDLLISLPFFVKQSKGCIFIIEDDPNVLVMKAHRGFSKELIQSCATVQLGTCLCGLAALTRECIFTDHIEERHEILYDDMKPHGHYCVPILYGETIYGVINLYTQVGHQKELGEEELIKALANTLVGLIKIKETESELEQSNRKYQSLLSRALSVVCELAPDGTIIYINDTVFSETGYKPESLIGKKWQDIFIAQENHTDVDELLARFYHEDILDFSAEFFTKDRLTKTFYWSSANHYSCDGTLKTIVLYGVEKK